MQQHADPSSLPPCSYCKGHGVDPDQYAHRFTSGGQDEPAPCPQCGGEGALPEHTQASSDSATDSPE